MSENIISEAIGFDYCSCVGNGSVFKFPLDRYRYMTLERGTGNVVSLWEERNNVTCSGLVPCRLWEKRMETEEPDGLNFFDMLFFDAMGIEKKKVYMEIGQDGIMEFRTGEYPHEGIRIRINGHDNLASNIYCRMDKDEEGNAGMSCRIKDDKCCDSLSGLCGMIFEKKCRVKSCI